MEIGRRNRRGRLAAADTARPGDRPHKVVTPWYADTPGEVLIVIGAVAGFVAMLALFAALDPLVRATGAPSPFAIAVLLIALAVVGGTVCVWLRSRT